MKILVTAFEPFDNNDINYSYEVLNKLKDHKKVLKVVLPVEYYNSFNVLKEIIDNNKPDIIILLGEARSYKSVGFEVIGINESSNHKDNKGFFPTNNKLVENGIDGLFSTLDYDVFKTAFEELNIDYFRSYSAGVYVCNALLYQSLLYIKENNLNIKCGFIHITKEETQPIDLVIKGLNNYINKLLLI